MRKRVINFILFVTILFSVFQIDIQAVVAQVQSTPFLVHGRVTDGYGNGLAGLRVFADSKYKAFLPLIRSVSSTMSSETKPGSQVQFFYSAVTDPDGYYTIDAIPIGTYILQVDLPGVTFNPDKREINAETTGSQDFDLYISDPVITPETVVLTDLSNQHLDGTTYDGVTFTFIQMTPELEQVDEGDIIVSGVSAVDPDGYLRKVTTVTPSGSGVIFTTIPATLDEAIQDGSAFMMDTLQPSQVVSMTALPGVTMLAPRPNEPLTFYFNVDNVVLYDGDGNPSTTNDQIRANGSIEFDMEFVFYLDMQWFQIRRFSLTNVNTLRNTLEIFTEVVVDSLDEEATLATQEFSPITLMVGPLPVVFVPKLDLVVGVDGSVKLGVSTEVSHEFSMRAGIEYQHSNGWSPIAEVTNTFNFIPPQLSLDMTLKGYVGAHFDLYLYGLAGPFVDITPYLEIKVEPLETPWWTLYGGLDVPVGFRANDYLEKVLDLDEYEVHAIHLKREIAHAQAVEPSEMVLVPAGEFQMGCDPDHNGGNSCYAEELPLHQVYLDAYYIDQTEVTNAQYEQCVAAGACNPPSSSASRYREFYYGNPDYDNYPVVYVTWYDSEDYCSWAGKRLPTEAEWEKTAKGGGILTYPWGDGVPNCSLANSSDDLGQTTCVGDTNAVGSYPDGASPFGALDMAGNVNEWVQDWWDPSYYGYSPFANPSGPTIGSYKVVRGGSFVDPWFYLRNAFRSFISQPNLGPDNVGFRCAAPAFPNNNSPLPPSTPTPPDQASNQPLDITLSWSGSDPDGETLVYDVFFDAGIYYPTTRIGNHQTSTELSVGSLIENTTYYWKVVAFDAFGAATEGPVWEFTTQGAINPGEMVFVPAGEFQMGCDPAHNGGDSCYNPELPLHTVYLDTYYIDSTEVTNAQYAQCVEAGACNPPYYSFSYWRSFYYGNPEYDNYPVIYVSWYDSEDYCTWAGKRLPTEAEWEKAARGTTVRAYPWGDGDPNCSLANSYNEANGSYCVYDTSEVGSYPSGASQYGVMDMAGNVWEWVNDWYSDTYYSGSPYENPQGPVTGSYKLLRGGSWWSDYWNDLRTAFRNGDVPPGITSCNLGFRCASSQGD